MSKTVNTVLTITILFGMVALLLYGYCSIQKLDESKEPNVVSTISQHINYKHNTSELSESTTADETEYVSEDEDFEVYVEEEEDENIEEIIIEDEITEADTIVSAMPIAAASPKSAYLIIAGSYQSLNNAENKVKQYKKMGLNAEIVQLRNSNLNSICIARTESEQKAKDTLETLISRHNIKAYMYKSH